MIEGELYADQVLWLLKNAARKAGSQKALAAKIGISAQHLHDMLSERRAITGKALEFLGFEAMTIYTRVRRASHEQTDRKDTLRMAHVAAGKGRGSEDQGTAREAGQGSTPAQAGEGDRPPVAGGNDAAASSAELTERLQAEASFIANAHEEMAVTCLCESALERVLLGEVE